MESREDESEDTHSRVVDQLLVQAEKFRVKVEAPKGMADFTDYVMPYDYEKLRSKFVKPEGLGPIDRQIMFLCNFDQDYEFFHVTSQIEPGLRVKIEKGEYIELERLLPRDNRSLGGNDEINRQLFQLIAQGMNNYLEQPVAKARKINSIRKWDQAFCVYAAIYTHANPERVSEIWQYVYVIHTAAAANHWDNVYYYDINLRQLMASKPWRSWGKTYTQGWNMAFNNNTMQYSYGNRAPSTSNSVNNHNNSNRAKDWKDDCCWKFNKNRCKRSGTDCNYDHRCTYCAGWYHGFFNCRKRQGRNQSFNNNNKRVVLGTGRENSPKKEKK